MKVTLLRLHLAGLIVLTLASVAGAQVRSGIVISTRANLRETPSQTGKVIQEVPIDSEIKVLDSKGAWFVVRIDDSVGWMHGNTFRFVDCQTGQDARPLSTARAPSDRANSAVPSAPARTRSEAQSSSSSQPSTTSTASKGYIRGPRGGCYYYSGSGRKVYVDRSLCN